MFRSICIQSSLTSPIIKSSTPNPSICSVVMVFSFCRFCITLSSVLVSPCPNILGNREMRGYRGRTQAKRLLLVCCTCNTYIRMLLSYSSWFGVLLAYPLVKTFRMCLHILNSGIFVPVHYHIYSLVYGS